MSRLPLIRLVSGLLVALLGLIVLACSYMNVGYFADLGKPAAHSGDDGTVGSLVSFVAGVLLVGLGVFGAATSSFGAMSREPRTKISQIAYPQEARDVSRPGI